MISAFIQEYQYCPIKSGPLYTEHIKLPLFTTHLMPQILNLIHMYNSCAYPIITQGITLDIGEMVHDFTGDPGEMPSIKQCLRKFVPH